MDPKLARFGRHMYDPFDKASNWPAVWTDFVAPVYATYQANPDAFLADLADRAERTGGWVAYGAERLMHEVSGRTHRSGTAYRRILEASLGFLRASGVPPMKVTGYEWDYWIDSGGDNETWVPRRPTPTMEQAPITDLGFADTRRLAQLTEDSNSNVFLVQRSMDGRYCWVVDARYSDEDLRRSQRVNLTADSLHEIYVRVGLSLQIPCYWYDRELEPYFPLKSPSFSR